MDDALISAIKNIIEISSDEEEIIKNLFTLKEYKKGEFFLKEGEVCKYVGFIRDGLVRYYINDDGEERTYGFSKENEFTSNFESFGPQTPSNQIIQALEDSTIWTITYENLQKLYAQVKNGERFGRLSIEYVLIKTLKDRNSFHTDSPKSRYEKFIKEHFDLQQRLSQYYIASYVGVKPQSLSRIRKRTSL
ncbi:Crp/Fnr family transcriptional regulator [Chryseobacterium sp. T16E-39]|uniref:Crp/Fnr family transcriptional regulator n=1 Tax=Chryseobacterium sp. T16E-39 TaxID=2015076 RepID=UPI000B5B4482|nr:Crp/Fnr family transcriptional regulator [Chryseobacterium sp. T16E-39]ASK32306.1 Crp/Fnr family transcriptional regulator [Chryseobacterium sp. T16E-39]